MKRLQTYAIMKFGSILFGTNSFEKCHKKYKTGHQF